jgi:GNAT superfamily N-acetyltransferase
MSFGKINSIETLVQDSNKQGAAVLHSLNKKGQEKAPIWIDLHASDPQWRHTAEDAITDSGFLDIRSPLEYPVASLPETFSQVMTLLRAEDVLPLSDVVENWDQLRAEILTNSPYDGIRFVAEEDEAAWIPASEDQVFYLSKDNEKTTLPALMSVEDFVGPCSVGNVFTFDGRGEDYDNLWEDLRLNCDKFPIVSQVSGYTICFLPDFEPFATLGLLDEDGVACGFYMGGQLWIDPAHRGKNLGSFMVHAAARITGGSPSDPEGKGLGYSEAGLRAHLLGWALGVDETYHNISDSIAEYGY